MSNLPPSRMTRRRFLQNGILSAAGLGLSQAATGCGWRLGNVRQPVVGAGNPQELFLYTWAQYVDQTLVSDFQRQSGLRTVRELFDSNEKMLAAIQAGKGANFSVLYPSEYFLPKLIEAGLLAKLDHARLENLDSIMPEFRHSLADDDNHYGVPFSWGTTGLIYNSEKIPEGITDWDYLWKHKEKLTRKITLLDDAREVLGLSLKTLGYSINDENPDHIKKAYEKLTQLKPHLASFTTDGWRSTIAAGDLWVAMGYSSDAGTLLKENPHLRYVVPKPGASRWSDWMAIPKAAPNPGAAYQWINYVLQEEIAANLAQRLSVTTPNTRAIRRLPPEIQSNAVSYPPRDILDRCEGMTALSSTAEAVFDRYWTQLNAS
jgi:spermidine/putrescine transport system substrate-binding protein